MKQTEGNEYNLVRCRFCNERIEYGKLWRHRVEKHPEEAERERDLIRAAQRRRKKLG